MRVLPASFIGLVLSGVGLVGGCSDGEDVTPLTGAAGTGSATSGGVGGGGGDEGTGGQSGGEPVLVCEPPLPAPEYPSFDWCERFIPGPAGEHEIAVDLSEAHATVRFWSPITEYAEADQALAKALLSGGALKAPNFVAYQEALPFALCTAKASAEKLGPASVEVVASVAIVRPGTGSVDIPDNALAIAVDLRDLPNVPELREAIELAVAPALAKPVPRPKARVRRHYGMTDELFTPYNLYKNTMAEVTRDPIPATGAVDRPLALLTSAQMAPEAADIAVALRVARRAFLVGEGVRVDVAESRWIGVGSAGVLVRTMDLIWPDKDGTNDDRLPDEIPADVRMGEPKCIAVTLPDLGAVPPAENLYAGRLQISTIDGFNKKQPIDMNLGIARAALVVAHGAVRHFYPYFGQVNDVIDDRLLETLDMVGMSPPTRLEERNILRRFSNALNDGHSLIRDFGAPKSKSFPAYIEDINGEAVVRQTLAVGVSPGDTIVSINGVAASDFYATELARTSAATDHYRFAVASFEFLRILEPTTFELRDVKGDVRSILFEPQPIADLAAVGFTPTLRGAGWLTDIGAPDVYYINLTGEVLYDQNDFYAQLTEAQSAAGLVLDMRGYPGIDMADVASRIIPQPWFGAQFRIPVLTGTDERTLDVYSDAFGPLDGPSYGGPVALLVGHATLSAAEHFALALDDIGRAYVVGRTSAGTDGNVTGVQLPGSYSMSFTGMDVRHVGGAFFHGIGILPDYTVNMTASNFANGDDPELWTAAAHLQPVP